MPGCTSRLFENDLALTTGLRRGHDTLLFRRISPQHTLTPTATQLPPLLSPTLLRYTQRRAPVGRNLAFMVD